MSTPVGLLGGVSIGPESTYNTKSSAMVFMIGAGSTIGPRTPLVRASRRLGRRVLPAARGPKYWDGDLSAAFTVEDDLMSDIYGLFCDDTASPYTIGDGSTPAVGSASVSVNHGGHEWTYTGGKATGLRIDIPKDGEASFALTMIGKTTTKEASASTVTYPADSLLILPGGSLSSLTIATVAMAFKSATIEIMAPHTGPERADYGAAEIREPLASGPISIKGSIVLELDDATGANTVATLATHLSSGSFATIAFGTAIFIANVISVGDPPAWQPGVQEFTLNWECVANGTITFVTS